MDIFAKNDVIFESLTSSKLTLSLDKKLSKVGSKVNVIRKDVINPNVIIHPKSIIGFISLKIRDKKAHIVVNTV